MQSGSFSGIMCVTSRADAEGGEGGGSHSVSSAEIVFGSFCTAQLPCCQGCQCQALGTDGLRHRHPASLPTNMETVTYREKHSQKHVLASW